jgi:SAM-dependent methyltransferase
VNVGFIRGDTQRLPFADDSADVVGCYATLEHLPDAEQALAELLRVARPGGWLVVYGPNMISPLRPISLMVRGLKQRRWHPDASPTFLIKALLWNVQKLLGLRKGFLYRRPLVDDLSFPGSDYDAICLVSNFDLRDFARRRHLTVRQLGQGTSRVGRAVAAWFPAVAGGVGLIAQKPPAAR